MVTIPACASTLHWVSLCPPNQQTSSSIVLYDLTTPRKLQDSFCACNPLSAALTISCDTCYGCHNRMNPAPSHDFEPRQSEDTRPNIAFSNHPSTPSSHKPASRLAPTQPDKHDTGPTTPSTRLTRTHRLGGPSQSTSPRTPALWKVRVLPRGI